MHVRPEYLVVGQVTRPHGIRGEVVVHPLTDHPETTFTAGVVLRAAGARGAPDPAAPPLRITSSRATPRGWLVKFDGFDGRTEAESLRGRDLLRPIDEVRPLADGEVFQHQLLGLDVVTEGGEVLGQVAAILEVPPTDLLEVRGPRGVLLIPYRREIVTGVDLDARRLVVDPPPGLLEL